MVLSTIKSLPTGALIFADVLKANELALEKYCELSKSIDCDFERRDNYVYSVYNRKILEKEMKALQKIRSDAEFCENVIIPKKTVGAVKFPNQAQFNPLKFIAAISDGLNIFENTFISEMIGTTAVTQSGKIYADKVIATTHFPFINKHGSYFLKLYQHRSYVIALKMRRMLTECTLMRTKGNVVSKLRKIAIAWRRRTPNRKTGRQLVQNCVPLQRRFIRSS